MHSLASIAIEVKRATGIDVWDAEFDGSRSLRDLTIAVAQRLPVGPDAERHALELVRDGARSVRRNCLASFDFDLPIVEAVFPDKWNDMSLENRLHEAFAWRWCKSAWLGYGDVLFLAFDYTRVVQPNGELREQNSLCKLNTNVTNWHVEGPLTASWGLDHATLLAAAESLVGERVIGWELLERLGLRIVFSGGKSLAIDPWPADEGVADAWSLSSPDGRILAVATDERTEVVEAKRPIGEWFGTL